jgi:hypothetical protein
MNWGAVASYPVNRRDAVANVRIFPRYYEIAEETRKFLLSNRV